MLEIKDLSVSLGDKKLLENINLTVRAGQRHRIAGANGSGKSTLAAVIAGDPQYKIDSGKIIFDGRDITDENATTRALMGIFVGTQNVPEIPGLTVISFLKHSIAAHMHFRTGHDLSMGQFLAELDAARTTLDIPQDWLNRSINVGFSGGERKRLMLLRLIMTRPHLALLDEPDSGADAQTQQLIADTIKSMPDTTFMFISHQPQFSEMVGFDAITTLANGKIVIE